MDACNANVRPGREPLITVSSYSGKDTLPYRQGAMLTTYMGDYIPPKLMPSFNGGLPCVSSCASNTGGCGASKKYLQSERSDILGNRVRRKFLYGRLPCDYSPFPDLAAARRWIQWERLHSMGKLIPSNVDSCKREEINAFHERCVNFRDYYLDATDTLHPDPFFDLGRPYPVRCPVDERVFKIGGSVCDVVRHLGPSSRCSLMPCLKSTGMMAPFPLPKLPRSPFQCDAVKATDPAEHQVLLV